MPLGIWVELWLGLLDCNALEIGESLGLAVGLDFGVEFGEPDGESLGL